ncbi:MAG: hypothetical protein ISEC1_P1510 [Thiomicrorhabdus sp.]|nr:MAG: hypothetical protein ISEC1_P1510 [Thiomicrorhabdus sp.]
MGFSRLREMQVIVFLLAASVVSLFSIPNVGGVGLFLPINLAVWCMVGLLILYTLYRIVSQQLFYFTLGQLYLLILFILIFSVGLINNSVSKIELIIIGLGMTTVWVFYICLSQYQINKASFQQLLLFFCLLGLAQALISFVQINDSYSVLHEITGYFAFKFVPRPVGTFQQVNMLSTFIAFTLIVSVYLCSLLHFKSRLYWKESLVLSTVSFSIYILLVSGSRAGLLSAITSVMVILWLAKSDFYQNRLGLVALLVAVVLGFGLLQLFPANVVSAGDKLSLLLSGADIRLYLYQSGWAMFLQAPFFGEGIGNYTSSLLLFSVEHPLPESLSLAKLEDFTHPHNEFLFWIIQGGIVAFVLIVLFSVWVLIQWLSRIRGSSNEHHRAWIALALFIPFFIQSLLSYPFTLSAPHLFLFIFCLYLLLGERAIYIRLSIGHVVRYIATSFIFILSLLVLFSAWHTAQSIKEAHYFKNRYFLYESEQYRHYEDAYFEYASKNPIFRGSIKFAMNKMAEKALEQDNEYDYQKYIEWVDRNPLFKKDGLVVMNLIKIYIAWDKLALAKKVLNEHETLFQELSLYQEVNRLIEG